MNHARAPFPLPPSPEAHPAAEGFKAALQGFCSQSFTASSENETGPSSRSLQPKKTPHRPLLRPRPYSVPPQATVTHPLRIRAALSPLSLKYRARDVLQIAGLDMSRQDTVRGSFCNQKLPSSRSPPFLCDLRLRSISNPFSALPFLQSAASKQVYPLFGYGVCACLSTSLSQ